MNTRKYSNRPGIKKAQRSKWYKAKQAAWNRKRQELISGIQQRDAEIRQRNIEIDKLRKMAAEIIRQRDAEIRQKDTKIDRLRKMVR